MQSSDLPARFPIPFGNAAGGGYIRPVPVASQIGIQDGAASLTDGFPPDTFTPGGVPPYGQDFNGLLFQVTAGLRWVQAGGYPQYNSAFAAGAGGYPRMAVLASTTLGVYWLNTLDGNMTDPDASGAANWTRLALVAASAAEVRAGTAVDRVVTPKALRDAGQRLFAVPGYRVEPDGYIHQWGRVNFSTSGVVAVTFPIPFPNALLSAQVSNLGDTPPAAFHGWGSPSNTGMNVTAASAPNTPPAAAGVGAAWEAWGY